MAQPPSPYTSPAALAQTRVSQNRTPSPPTQPQSKRDKRRTMLSEKLSDMINSFSANHYDHYYAQLSAIQCDINLVMRADPYTEGPLDDTSEGISKLVTEVRDEICRNRPIPADGEESFNAISGKFYSRFVDDVNAAVEERDRDLTTVYKDYQEGLDELRRTNQYKIQLAHEEHQLLSKTLRERLIQGVNQKRAKLLRDKEQLDIADSNALLLNPNQFSLGNPSSPGGAHGNRKTRHTRGRPGEGEEANSTIVSEGNKRKRKAGLDETDTGSPAPSGRVPENGAAVPYRDAKAKLIHSQFEAPLYSIDRLFTERELAMNMNRAHVQTMDFFARLKAQSSNPGATNGNVANGGSGRASIDLNTVAENEAASAADVGDVDSDVVGAGTRTSPVLGSLLPAGNTAQTVHATRSTQRSNPLSDLANTAAALPSYPVNISASASNKNPAAPPPPGLSEAEIQGDLAFMSRPIGDPTLERLMEECCERQGPMNMRSWTAGRAAADVASGNGDGAASERAGEGAPPIIVSDSIARIQPGPAAFGGVPMSKASSLGGASDVAGGTASVGSAAMMRSASAADYGAPRPRAR